MIRKEYSAGAVKHSFWFLEFRKIIILLSEGNSLANIKQMNIEANIFAAPTEGRAKQIFNTVSVRVRSLDESVYGQFVNSDISTQKIIALIAVMNTDTLFFDFMYEVYREKVILGNEELQDSDLRVFFKNKQVQCERVAGWKEYTLKRLGACYKTFLVEAGVVRRGGSETRIVKPVLDFTLEKYLIDNGMEQFVYALTGVW